MTGLTITVMKLGLLAILWIFVLLALGVVRSDVFGAGSRAGRGRAATKAAPVPAAQLADRPSARPRRGGVPTRLEVVSGSLAGTNVALTGVQITLGRAHDSTIVLDDDFASSRHARIYPDATGQWVVEDLGSTNGTYLDRTKINGPTPIPLGVPVRIGKTALELKK
ncbi:FHA domain-containing protein FhaB/FipA [Actinospica sp.]|jgi:pSer/pThr/pTyr-binding forkhead associated (FHA) protein|uniref:FHA domain-containing protein FhaB/FipA n=1 Tax=Actinospica sp. TaxID=1872142 RepID=UPI002C0C1CD1|nr:FHA domain-containing protein [Actinospica sp.]HWG27261.1 FHA domain-containing protein [Actinospica sp.]